ncbi:hypothetical protein MMC25_002608 [Agyrium rufum]|nr:hypothetical protein [Agyrium rufum]
MLDNGAKYRKITASDYSQEESSNSWRGYANSRSHQSVARRPREAVDVDDEEPVTRRVILSRITNLEDIYAIMRGIERCYCSTIDARAPAAMRRLVATCGRIPSYSPLDLNALIRVQSFTKIPIPDPVDSTFGSSTVSRLIRLPKSDEPSFDQPTMTTRIWIEDHRLRFRHMCDKFASLIRDKIIQFPLQDRLDGPSALYMFPLLETRREERGLIEEGIKCEWNLIVSNGWNKLGELSMAQINQLDCRCRDDLRIEGWMDHYL